MVRQGKPKLSGLELERTGVEGQKERMGWGGDIEYVLMKRRRIGLGCRRSEPGRAAHGDS